MSADDSLQSPAMKEQVTAEGTHRSDFASAPDTVETGTQNPNVVKSVEAPGSRNNANSLLPKLLRTTRVLLTSHSFFYSYDMDITRRSGTGSAKSSDLPLYKSADPLVSYIRLHPRDTAS